MGTQVLNEALKKILFRNKWIAESKIKPNHVPRWTGKDKGIIKEAKMLKLKTRKTY